MNTSTRLSIGAFAVAASCTLLTAATQTAQAAPGGRAAMAAPPPCGLHVRGSQDYYTNCAAVSEKIWVTVNWGYGKENHFRCIQAGERQRLGYYLSIHNTYHDSWNC
ncbi:DUF6355 family natural product biosynthesis protein [Actinomadura sp. NPDC048955]|uniref:DUF6355 family natural product biosynthesis protein n=1 Tax=Actinomadura sp. NPDC048955 TaxID=3158228 RepID=UPI00340D406F